MRKDNDRYNLLDEILAGKPIYDSDALDRYIDTRSFMRQLLKARSDAAEVLQRDVTPEEFKRIKRDYDELDEYVQTFYFACGVFKAHQMFLKIALPDPSEAGEDVTMESERLYAQSGYEQRMNALWRNACLAGALETTKEGDPVSIYSAKCHQAMIERSIYHFTYGLEYGTRVCKLFDPRYREDPSFIQALYGRLDLTDK